MLRTDGQNGGGRFLPESRERSFVPLTAVKGRDRLFAVLEHAVPVLLLIFIALNPVPYSTAIKEICFYSALGFILILAGSKRIPFSFRSPLTWPFALFTAWVFVGLFFALDQENSLHDFQTHWLKYLALYYVLINVFSTRQRLAWLSWALTIPAALLSLGLMINFYAVQNHPLSRKFVTGIPEIAVNGLGIVAVPAALFSLHYILVGKRLSLKIFALFCLVSTSVACFLTQAKGTVLALFLGIFMLCFDYKKLLLVCLGIFLIVFTFSPVKDRFMTISPITALRLDIHYITYEIIKDHPVVGIGFGMQTYGNRKFIDLESYYRRIPERFRGYLHTDPHSMPFSVAVRTGLIGLGLFLWILFVPFRMAWQCMQDGDPFIRRWGICLMAAFVAILTIGFFEPFFSHVPEVVFFLLMAMLTAVWHFLHCKEGKNG